MVERAESPVVTRAAVLVGGRASRMHGIAKGLLVAPSGEAIVARWRALFAALDVEATLVGGAASCAPYVDAGLVQADECALDEPGIPGPLAGLVAALSFARARGAHRLVVVACDMPHVEAATLERLVRAPAQPGAGAIAARRGERWEPLFARYDVEPALAAARRNAARGSFALRDVLVALGARSLATPEAPDVGEAGAALEAELADWDALPELTAADVARNAALLS